MGKDLSIIFERKPSHWGLRGDPYLWEEMKGLCIGESLDIDDYCIAGFVSDYFEKTTGKPLTFDAEAHVERLAHGGMSSGCVCGSFWITKGIPHLIENLHRVKEGYPVVALCGSTKYKNEILELEKTLTLEGNIVINMEIFEESEIHEILDDKDEENLLEVDRLLHDIYWRKIDLSDYIYVINVDGYIGDQIKRLIEYAKMNDKAIKYYEEL